MPRIWLALVLFWLCGPAWALLPATLDNTDLRLPLGSSMAFLEDQQGELSVEQVGALADERFTPAKGEHANLGKNDSVWWFKVRLNNSLAQNLALSLISYKTNRFDIDENKGRKSGLKGMLDVLSAGHFMLKNM